MSVLVPRTRSAAVLAAAWALALAASVGCGKKGPPLPPLIRLPAAPADVSAVRRGALVEVNLTVPAANTDGSRPANVDRVEVYALAAAPTVSADEIITKGTRVASIDVKSPRDANELLDPDDPESLKKLLEPTGLDQGVVTSAEDRLSADDVSAAGTRVYAAIGVSTSGRRGPASARVAIPLGASPPVPSGSTTRYDEKGITVTWPGVKDPQPVDGYYVYERPILVELPAPGEPPPTDTRLTPKLLTTPPFIDTRVEWDVERCYVVRSVRLVDGVGVESDAATPTCVTPVDTFAPPPPTGIDVLPATGRITLVWEASPAADLAGYIVLRGPAGATTLTPVTPSPITLTTFVDTVPSEVRFVWAVQAVDKAGNRSALSSRIEESAR